MMGGRRLEAVLFDMDGVIIDSEPLWTNAEQHMLARRNLTYSAELKALLMGRDSQDSVALFIEHYNLNEKVEDVIEERDHLVAGLFQEFLQPIPHVLALIRSVRENGVKTAVVSSSPRRLVDLVLNKLGVNDLFDLVLSGDQVARGKPAPDIYLAAAEALHVKPENSLVIEDAPNGVVAAKAAGMSCLAVCTSVRETELAAADQVVSGFFGISYAELEQLMV